MEIFSYKIIPVGEDTSSASNFEQGYSYSVEPKDLSFDPSKFCSTEREIC